MHLHEVISKNLILSDPFTVHGLGIIPLLGDTALDLPPIDLLERTLSHQVWREVDESLSEFRVHSPTANFTEGREKVSHRIEEFVDRIRPVEKQIGAVFFSPAGVLGAEVLGTLDLFAASLAKIVRSFAFEVLSIPGFETVPPEPVKNWWEKVLEASLSVHPPPGAEEVASMQGI
jgi:hypothetical protein